MNIYITLDYELFFGPESGSVDDCIIKPTEALLEIVDPYNIKIVFFVDVGYLIKLKEYQSRYPELHSDYQKVTKQIKQLSQAGHAIELHIHPHWENTVYNGDKWVFDTIKYKLSDFSKPEAHKIVLKYSAFLKEISGKSPIAFRAGGWSAQPFEHIKEALKEANIIIDSTVYPKGYHVSKNQRYDFRNVPQYKTKYRFNDNLTVEDSKGYFIEYPISSYRVSPFFFWRFAFNKFKKSKQHVSFGKGRAIPKPRKELLRLMTRYSNTVVSIDGFKASFINKAFKNYQKNTKQEGHFVLIGHPKAFTPYSLNKTKAFIAKQHMNNNFYIFKK